jgi:ABC-type uncharacterized transport system ATPase subunit
VVEVALEVAVRVLQVDQVADLDLLIQALVEMERLVKVMLAVSVIVLVEPTQVVAVAGADQLVVILQVQHQQHGTVALVEQVHNG